MRLLPSEAASRAQQSAVICREGRRAVRVGCRAHGVLVEAACGLVAESTGAGRGLLALACKDMQSCKNCVAQWTGGSRTREPWLHLEELAAKSMRASGSQVPLLSGPRWFTERNEMGSLVLRNREEVAMRLENFGAIAGSWT